MKFRQNKQLRVGGIYRATYDRPASSWGNPTYNGIHTVQITSLNQGAEYGPYYIRAQILSTKFCGDVVSFRKENFKFNSL